MNLVEVGYFSKAHGLKGELILKISKDFNEDETKAVFVEHQGSKAPYFILDLKPTPSGCIVSLEEITNIEQARALIGKSVFLDESFIFESAEISEWMDFEITETTLGLLGKVFLTTDNGIQTLLHLTFKNKEVILPLVDEFVVEINYQQKKMIYQAPDGLIDVYLQEAD